MWVSIGFGHFSIVHMPEDAVDVLTVRAYAESDLDSLRAQYLPSLGVPIAGPPPFAVAARVSREALADAMSRLVRNAGQEDIAKVGPRAATYAHAAAVLATPFALEQSGKGKRVRFGAAIVLPGHRVVLLRPKKDLGYSWTFPKGPGGPGETAEEAVRRIVIEHCGLDVEFLRTLPGPLETDSSRSYFWVVTPRAPELVAFALSSKYAGVDVVDFDTAEKLVAKTRDVSGRARDLELLALAHIASLGHDGLRSSSVSSKPWTAPRHVRKERTPRILHRLRGAAQTSSIVFVPGASREAVVRVRDTWVRWNLDTGESIPLPLSGEPAAFAATQEGLQLIAWPREASLLWPSMRPSSHALDLRHGSSGPNSPLIASTIDGKRIVHLAGVFMRQGDPFIISDPGRLEESSLVFEHHYLDQGSPSANSLFRLEWTSDGRFVTGGSLGSNIHVGEVESGVVFDLHHEPDGHPEWFATHSDQPIAALCSRVVGLFDIEGRRLLCELKLGGDKPKGEFSRRGRLVCTYGGAIVSWDWQNDALTLFETMNLGSCRGEPLRFTLDRSIALVASEEGEVLALDAKDL